MKEFFKFRKAVQAMNFFATKENGAINKMKAIKLIWLSDRLHLRKYGRPIIFDTYYAMKLGPVASSTKDLAEKEETFLGDDEKIYRNSYLEPTDDNLHLKSIKPIDIKVFSKSDLSVLEDVYNEFGEFSEFELSEYTHKFPDWNKHSSLLNSGYSRVNMEYLDFFSNMPCSKKDITDPDQLKAAKELFEENYSFV